ncbi:MAG: hypothetical protein QW035_02065 [Candidatus Anstonellales archaeon]
MPLKEADKKKQQEGLELLIKKAEEKGLDAGWVMDSLISNPYLRKNLVEEKVLDRFLELIRVIKNRGANFSDMLCFTSMLQFNPDVEVLLSINKEVYLKAEKMLKDSGIKKPKPITVLNFAYAINAIGIENTFTLYRELGIENFGRYTKNLLEKVYSNLKKASKKPLLLVAFNKSDYIGAFYKEGAELERLAKYYNVILFEVEKEEKLYSNIVYFSNMYGKIDTLILAGHGEPTNITLGDKNEMGMIDLSDKEEIAKLKKFFVDNPTVVLLSCSTGGMNIGGIGHLISKELECTVFAPQDVTERTHYILNPEGKIIGVEYDVPKRTYLKGVPIK